MRSSHTLAALALALVLASPAAASASCAGANEPRWVAHQWLVALLNPMGAEHNLRIGLCLPLYDSTELALRLNHVEFGATSYVSPIYAIGGGYAQFGPASFFFVRVELNAMGVWPLPIDGVGYFPLTSYGDRFSSDALPSSRAMTASGWNFRTFSVLRGRVDVATLPWGALTLVAVDAFIVDYHELGSAPFYTQVRHDVVTARQDWLLGNEATLAVGIPIPGGPELRIGGYDALRYVPGSGYLGHQFGGVLMLAWERPAPGISELTIFIRVGGYLRLARERFALLPAAVTRTTSALSAA